MSRTRTRGVGFTYADCTCDYYTNGVKVPGSSWTVEYSFHNEEKMVDVISQDYFKRVSSGEIINNPLLVEKWIESCSFGNATTLTSPNFPNDRVEYRSGPWTKYWHTSGAVSLIDIAKYNAFYANINQLLSLAKQGALANVDSTPYSFLEDLGELKSTVNTLKEPLGSARVAAGRFEREVKQRISKGKRLKGYVGRVEAASKAIADTWLSTMYEWRPIIISLSEISKGLQKVHTRPRRMTARHTERSSLTLSGLSDPSWGYYYSEAQIDVKIKAWILYEMANKIDHRDWDLGVRLKDVPKTGWALLPYTFVTDRFLDVGKSIEALTNLLDPRLSILAAGTTMTLNDKQSFSATWDTPSSGWTMNQPLFGGVFSKEYHKVERSPWLPQFSDSLPTFTGDKAISDLSNMLDITALVTKNFSPKSYI